MAQIALWRDGGGIAGYAVVDDADVALASQRRWNLDKGGYARCVAGRRNDKRAFLMHREILGDPPFNGAQVDHVNGDRLDNRRANLRWVTRDGNGQNQKAHKDSQSGHRGIYRERGGWRAQVKSGGRRVWQGRFGSIEAAVAAVTAARKSLLPLAVN
jgi:hypothetical protein